MDFGMVSRPEKMFFRHKQAEGNFYDVFLCFWWIYLEKLKNAPFGAGFGRELGDQKNILD